MVVSFATRKGKSMVITVQDAEKEDGGITPSVRIATQHTPITTDDKLKLERVYFNNFKLVDITFKWTDFDLKLPSETSNHLVIGVIGKQGVGKTTIIDALCEGYQFEASKRPLSSKGKARDLSGISLRMTQDRFLYLDCQPPLRSSVLDFVNKMDRQPPTEVNCLDNWAEMQSIQLACFMLSVCHIVLVVSEWELDMEMLDFIRIAEVLKPTAPSVTDISGNSLARTQHVPNIVFVVNKHQSMRKEQQLHTENVMLIRNTLSKSNLNFSSGISDSELKTETISATEGHHLIRYPVRTTEPGKLENVNLCYLPVYRGQPLTPHSEQLGQEAKHVKVNLSPRISVGWNCGNFVERVRWLKNMLSSLPITQISPLQNNELRWLSHCHKMWDATKKSQLIAEYCQFMT
ncbi:nonsense-mediated mRNA decay factor SMG9-like isoform X2 [Convolutriloba macropyga]